MYGQEEEEEYELYALIVHSGTGLGTGHYFMFALCSQLYDGIDDDDDDDDNDEKKVCIYVYTCVCVFFYIYFFLSLSLSLSLSRSV